MIRRAVAVLAAALLLAPTPAQAGTAAWTTRLSCANGTLVDQGIGADDLGRMVTWVSGWIEPCGTPDADERFGLIYVVQNPIEPRPRAYVFESRLRPYDQGRTHFEGAVDPAVEDNAGLVIAVCLAYASGRPIACVQPVPQGGVDLPPLPPLPDVSAIVPESAEEYTTQPNCATCV